jgi:GNAT superfamily N-acetyltransferase
MSTLPSHTSPRFHYRLAAIQDWGDIAAVTQQAYGQYELEIMEDCRESFQQGMKAVLAASTAEMEWWVAETEHGVSGAVLFCHPGATLQALDGSTITLGLPEARLLAVSPQARGLGLGRTLMQVCQRAAGAGHAGNEIRHPALRADGIRQTHRGGCALGADGPADRLRLRATARKRAGIRRKAIGLKIRTPARRPGLASRICIPNLRPEFAS